MNRVELVPAILRKTWEGIAQDWNKIVHLPDHIQIDVTDGIFAGDRSFRDLKRFKQLPESQKIELHMMVHTPGHYAEGITDLNPARVIFHIESFNGTDDVRNFYTDLRHVTSAELALAINPETPVGYLDEHIDLVDYVLFMGYNPGWANQPLNPIVYTKMAEFRGHHPHVKIAVDGHVGQETIKQFVHAGATILCANTAIFGRGDPAENYRQLAVLAQAAA